MRNMLTSIGGRSRTSLLRAALSQYGRDAPARELALEFRERQEPGAGEGPALGDSAVRELAREQDRGHAGDLGAVQRVGGEVPFRARPAAVLAPPEDAHQHPRELAAEGVHSRGDPVERPGPALERHLDAVPAQPRRRPQRALLHAELERGTELDGAHLGIDFRNQLEVGHVARSSPARPQAVEAQALQLLPSPGVAPLATAHPLERSPRIARHRGDGRPAARRPLSGGDRDLDLFDLRNVLSQARDHRRGQRGHAARTRDSEAVGRARRRLKVLWKARDELASVCEIEIMGARGERGARHTVVLRLEGAGAVDHQVRSEALEHRREVRGGMIEARVPDREVAESAVPLVGVAARRDHLHARRRDPAAHPGAEVAVAPYYDNAHCLPKRTSPDGPCWNKATLASVPSGAATIAQLPEGDPHDANSLRSTACRRFRDRPRPDPDPARARARRGGEAREQRDDREDRLRAGEHQARRHVHRVGVSRAHVADIGEGKYIGTTTLGERNGALAALEVHIFPEAMRGVGEGHYAWDLKPNSKMTNGNVAEVKAMGKDRMLTVKYKGGEQRVSVPANAKIVMFEPAEKTELKKGSLTSARVNVGMHGTVPPM